MDTMSSADARNVFPDLISQANYGKKRTVITRRGKRVAAIVPIEDLERLQALEDVLDAEKIDHALKNEEFENWTEAKNEIMKHFGFTEDDLQIRNIEEGNQIHKDTPKA